MIHKSVRNLKQCWNHFPSRKKDKLIAFAPLIATLIFIFALFLDIAHLLSKEKKRDTLNATQILEILAIQIKSDLQRNEDALVQIAQTIHGSEAPEKAFFQNIEKFATPQHSDITAYYWQEKNHAYNYPQNGMQAIPLHLKEQTKILNHLEIENHDTLKKIQNGLYDYSKPPDPENAVMYFSIMVPGKQDNQAILSVAYNLNNLLKKHLPRPENATLDIWFENSQGEVLRNTPKQRSDQPPQSHLTVNIEGTPLVLAAKPIQTTFTSATGKIFLGISICMGLTVIGLLLLNWQYARLRAKAQQKVAQEVNFRLAIEKSIPVGLQAIDYSGKIIYVNPAFCEMTSYTEQELIGCPPPYPYWSATMPQSFTEIIQSDISQNPAANNGFDTELQRRNGELFYARVYMSPLIDIHGNPNGWITTMTDITEMQQAREELTLAGKRFTTVLESLDTLISVVAVGNNELLFTNYAYKSYFDNKAQGHLVFARNLQQNIDPDLTQDLSQYTGQSSTYANKIGNQDAKTGKNRHDIYIDIVDRWFDIRERYLAWVDGRLAHMIFATNVTERHLAQEQSIKLHKRTQEVSRLITMGEMASSIAHELNQPLTAIHNYCSGLMSRIKTDQLSEENLTETLEKTSKQAIRAGQIIQRIRSYVQKSTPPQRTLIPAAHIMDNVRELAEIDTKRHNIKLTITIERNLPDVYADPLLIEQVLLNLIRNAIDAIEIADRPVEQRFIDIRIQKDTTAQTLQYIEFSIIDSGTGISNAVRKEIFMPFFTTKKNGLGIGLNLCNSIIESHGGSFHIKNISKDDRLIGCCFSFSLPIENSQKPE